MSKFTEIAKNVSTSISRVMKNREKINVDDLIHRHPDRITIVDFDFIELTNKSGEKEQTPVLTCEEEPDNYFYGGHVIKQIFSAFVSENYSRENVDAVAAEFAEAGGIAVKMAKGKTKSNNPIVRVEILD